MNKEELCAYLKLHCRGYGRVVSSRLLERLFDVRGIELRRNINQLRREGEAICSNGYGYYYAATAAELSATIRSLQHRAQEIEAAVEGLSHAYGKLGDDP